MAGAHPAAFVKSLEEIRMASSTPGSAAGASPLRSFGRGFAVADPERQREVTVRMPVSALASPAIRTRPASPSQWFRLTPSPTDEGDSCRRGR